MFFIDGVAKQPSALEQDLEALKVVTEDPAIKGKNLLLVINKIVSAFSNLKITDFGLMFQDDEFYDSCQFSELISFYENSPHRQFELFVTEASGYEM